MIYLYERNDLTVCEILEYSIHVDAEEHGPIKLRDIPSDIIDALKIGEKIDCYVYIDIEGDVVASMAHAYSSMNSCVSLQVVSTTEYGAFMDWGLPKDLFLPFGEQNCTVREGQYYVVYITEDQQQRPMATMRLHKHLEERPTDLEEKQEVSLMIAGQTDLGYKAVINGTAMGLIYHQEVSTPLKTGETIRGWVKQIREDGKITLNVNMLNDTLRSELEERIMNALHDNGGTLPISDKSAPEDIQRMFGVSKGNFKRAIGNLYKQRAITITPAEIKIV